MFDPELLRYRTSDYESVLDVREDFRDRYGDELGLDFGTAVGRYPPNILGNNQTVWTIESDNLSVSVGENLEDLGDMMLESTGEDEVEARLSHNPAPIGGNSLTGKDVELMDMMYQGFGQPTTIEKMKGLWQSGHFGRELMEKHYEKTGLDI